MTPQQEHWRTLGWNPPANAGVAGPTGEKLAEAARIRADWFGKKPNKVKDSEKS